LGYQNSKEQNICRDGCIKVSPEKPKVVSKEAPRLPPPINQEALKAIFVEGFGIGVSETKDVMEIIFLSVQGRKSYVNSRFVMTKERAKNFIKMMEAALKKMQEED